jgi:hypothetical protein
VAAVGRLASARPWDLSAMPKPVLGPAQPDPWDNAMCESFFATLEYELLARHRFVSQTEAKMAVFSLAPYGRAETSRFPCKRRTCMPGSTLALAMVLADPIATSARPGNSTTSADANRQHDDAEPVWRSRYRAGP